MTLVTLGLGSSPADLLTGGLGNFSGDVTPPTGPPIPTYVATTARVVGIASTSVANA
jgi:hypothetical protein